MDIADELAMCGAVLERINRGKKVAASRYAAKFWQQPVPSESGAATMADVLYPGLVQPEVMVPHPSQSHLCVCDLFDGYCRLAYRNAGAGGQWQETGCMPVATLNIPQRIDDWTDCEPEKSCWHLVGDPGSPDMGKLLKSLNVQGVSLSGERLEAPAVSALHFDLIADKLTVGINRARFEIYHLPEWGLDAWFKAHELDETAAYLKALYIGKGYSGRSGYIDMNSLRLGEYVRALLQMVPRESPGMEIRFTGWLGTPCFKQCLCKALEDRGYTLYFNYDYGNFFKG